MATTRFEDIIQKIADENGKDIFLEQEQLKLLLKDYTQFKRESSLLLAMLNADCAKYINEATNLVECKQLLVKLLEDDYSLSPQKSSEMLDILIYALRGENAVNQQAVLFFVVDVSGSMTGEKIGTLNTAFRELLPELKEFESTGVVLKIAFLTFSTGCSWIHPSPIPLSSFQWNKLEADGESDLGMALRELSTKMSKEEFLSDLSTSTYTIAPIIFLMMDGEPTDDYKNGLAVLQKNIWFKYAVKVAVAIGNDADKDVLEEFTEDNKSVIDVCTPEALKKWIRFIPGPRLDELDTNQAQERSRQEAVAVSPKTAQQTKSDLADTDGWD